MSITQIIPPLAAGSFVLAALVIAIRKPGRPVRSGWILPALLAAGFFGFTLYTAQVNGQFGFWPEHERNFWGNQIWMDLLLAAGIGWVFMVPRARAAGMRPLAWLPLMATGSIGLLAMLARLLYLEENSTQAKA